MYVILTFCPGGIAVESYQFDMSSILYKIYVFCAMLEHFEHHESIKIKICFLIRGFKMIHVLSHEDISPEVTNVYRPSL